MSNANYGSQAEPNRPVAVRAWAQDRKVWIALADGREISFPAEKFRRLRDASDQSLSEVKIEARGTALRWENLDEDLTIDGILHARWLP